jgi:heme a synthase
MSSLHPNDRSRAVAVWLFLVAAMVFAMVLVGGATRLTGSGLSITEWKPISGAMPPMSAEDWMILFRKYQQIPEARQVNPDMTLEGFKAIFWWEWGHRQLGRLIGLVYALPFAFFAFTHRIPRRLMARCWLALALGALQALVGWLMVESGLTDRVDVAPERLMAHLGLALVIFCLLIWTGFEAWAGPGRPISVGRWKGISAALAAAVFVQILLGGLVAGNDAGMVYNDWPLMNGRLFPADYAADSLWRTVVHSPAAVQLHHRLGAYLLFAGAWLAAWGALRSRVLGLEVRQLAIALAGLVTLQAILGIVTLVHVTPLGLALAHQALAAVVLGTSLAFAWRARRA